MYIFVGLKSSPKRKPATEWTLSFKGLTNIKIVTEAPKIRCKLKICHFQTVLMSIGQQNDDDLGASSKFRSTINHGRSLIWAAPDFNDDKL